MVWAKVWVYLYKMQDDLICTLRLFAHDALLYHKITHNDDTLALQRDLDKLGLWANRWRMLFNPTNCYKMSVYRSRSPGVKDYTLYNQALVAVQQHHYSGVLLSSDLWWNSHVGKNVKKGNSTLTLILAGLLIFFVVVYLNINFRLNGGGESSVRGLKNFSSFLQMHLKNKGIVILVMNTTGNLMDLLCV